jgi:hypothetical protein
MIHLIIKDGLGNQMFQYAYARYLQERYLEAGITEELVINPYFIKNTLFNDNDLREMSIHHFVLKPDVSFLNKEAQKKSMRDFKLKTLLTSGVIDLFNWRIRKIKPSGKEKFLKRAQKGIYYTFFPYTNYIGPIASCSDKFIFGFFQDPRNFQDISNLIKKELLVKDLPTEKNKEMIEAINNVNSVCLHIRRGDYLNPRWKNLQICTFEYYNNAINEILKHEENPVFFVFSNSHEDLEWIKENYHFKDVNEQKEIQLIYVDLQNPDYEELRLMYSCKHFIISNSTFSWWGAYLSSYSKKIVIAPERWNLAVDNDDSIYLKDWIKISAL